MLMFDGACWWCGVAVQNYVQRVFEPEREDSATKATRDHVHPRGCGGREAFDNLVLACRRCNQDRGSLSEGRWRRRMREAGYPPRRPRDFKELRARWILTHPEWFREYFRRLEFERVAALATRGGPPQLAGPDRASGRGTGSAES